MAGTRTAIVGQAVAERLQVDVRRIEPPMLAVLLATPVTAREKRQEDRLDDCREVVAALGEWPAASEVGGDPGPCVPDAVGEVHKHLDGTRDMVHVVLAEVSSKSVADQFDMLPRSRNDGRRGGGGGVFGSRETEFGGNDLPAFLDPRGGRDTLGGEDVARSRPELVLRPGLGDRGSTLD